MLKSLLISAAVSALLSGFGVWKITHDLNEARVARLVKNYAEAEQRALAAQQRQIIAWNTANLEAAVSEGNAQLVILRQITDTKLEVPRYVTIHHPCLSFGFIRVLDAAGLGVSPDSLPLPAGVTDDTCAPLDPAAVAQAIIANIGDARANAEQLNALSALTRKY